MVELIISTTPIYLIIYLVDTRHYEKYFLGIMPLNLQKSPKSKNYYYHLYTAKEAKIGAN